MIALVLIFGLVWGSFLSVVINRIDNLGSVLVSRSHCPKCKKKLGVIDLFPLLSFIFLRGKCRHCKAKISLEYPLIELLSCFLVLAIYLKFSISFFSVMLFLSVSALLVASFLDARHMEVDLWLFIAGTIFGLIWFFSRFGLNSGALVSLVSGILVAIILPLAFYLVSRETWMGLGDILFALWTACILGFPGALAAIFIAFLSGAIFGIILLIIKGKISGIKVPFGPFIAFGAIVALFYGQQIVDFYLKLIGF